MPDQASFDTIFNLPAVDDEPAIETGVILMGLDAERLVAGLGLATLTDDAALVALLVDHLRHAAPYPFSLDNALTAGARRWLSTRSALLAADPGPVPIAASPRQAWSQTQRLLSTADIGDTGPATRAFLTACWIRRHDVDRFTSTAR